LPAQKNVTHIKRDPRNKYVPLTASGGSDPEF